MALCGRAFEIVRLLYCNKYRVFVLLQLTISPMTASFDLDRYFARISYTGERAATLNALCGIHACHAMAIPFENISPILHVPVKLDLASLEAKLVVAGRGGWCYEQNLLLSHVLRTLGFDVTWLAARVLWNAAEGVVPPRSHMLLRIDLDGKTYIADVGFGGLTMTAPLLLETEEEQATPHEPFRLLRSGQDYVQQAKLAGAWKTIYRFDLQEQQQADYEVSNWYLGNFPECFLIHQLLVGRPAQDRRYALHNNQLTIHHLSGESEKRQLSCASDLRDVLEKDFLLTLPSGDEVDAMLKRFAAMLPA